MGPVADPQIFLGNVPLAAGRELVKLFDTVEYDPAYDYKKERRRR